MYTWKMYSICNWQARKHNLHLEANFLRWFNLERYDLMIKKQRYDNTKFGSNIRYSWISFMWHIFYKNITIFAGIGLFARSSIPKDTPLGFYPGDRIDAIELRKRSSERIEEDRYVFTLSPNELYAQRLSWCVIYGISLFICFFSALTVLMKDADF